MPYTALPDRRMPYDNDGSSIYQGTIAAGAAQVISGSDALELQDDDFTAITRYGGSAITVWLFFPEQREVTGLYAMSESQPGGGLQPVSSLQGSNDTTNGLDGTWETASMASGYPSYVDNFSWRSGIKPVSFTGPKKTIRMTGVGNSSFRILHVYGEKTAGQTPDDLIYVDHDTTPGVEYASPEDFADQPLGTTVVRQFRLKNTSATKTANTINVQCNDSDFAISTDGTTWVVTINIASLGPGAQSATMYVRCTTPAPGNPLGPRFARIVTTVASYT